ncbi:hypothetical protein V2T44_23905, partial [Serratia ficaria]|uniref:hypothetical protein n=1 Tax=Serratia ficaria TaxID=61651 RepID=UPI002ED60B28|nr:hypothetical protein [Serratia ficaria]
MPNSEVKRRSADGSVGSPHARVGHCQASNKTTSPMRKHGAFCFGKIKPLQFLLTFIALFNIHHKNHVFHFT